MGNLECTRHWLSTTSKILPLASDALRVTWLLSITSCDAARLPVRGTTAASSNVRVCYRRFRPLHAEFFTASHCSAEGTRNKLGRGTCAQERDDVNESITVSGRRSCSRVMCGYHCHCLFESAKRFCSESTSQTNTLRVAQRTIILEPEALCMLFQTTNMLRASRICVCM